MAIIPKTIENFVEPRMGQWQLNQKAELPLVSEIERDVYVLEGNTALTNVAKNATTVKVVPGANRTVLSGTQGGTMDNLGALPGTQNQTVAELQIITGATALSVGLGKLDNTLSTIACSANTYNRFIYDLKSDSYFRVDSNIAKI